MPKSGIYKFAKNFKNSVSTGLCSQEYIPQKPLQLYSKIKLRVCLAIEMAWLTMAFVIT
jgi:hypothetical protein